MNWCNSCGHVFDGHAHLPSMEEKMNQSEQNLLEYAIGLLGDAQHLYFLDKKEEAVETVNTAYIHLAIFLGKNINE